MHRKQGRPWQRKLRSSWNRYRAAAHRRATDIRSGIFQLGGLSAFIAAAAEWSTIAGWFVTGLSCFIFEWLTRSKAAR